MRQFSKDALGFKGPAFSNTNLLGCHGAPLATYGAVVGYGGRAGPLNKGGGHIVRALVGLFCFPPPDLGQVRPHYFFTGGPGGGNRTKGTM
jgi:hypothetical protein